MAKLQLCNELTRWLPCTRRTVCFLDVLSHPWLAWQSLADTGTAFAASRRVSYALSDLTVQRAPEVKTCKNAYFSFCGPDVFGYFIVVDYFCRSFHLRFDPLQGVQKRRSSFLLFFPSSGYSAHIFLLVMDRLQFRHPGTRDRTHIRKYHTSIYRLAPWTTLHIAGVFWNCSRESYPSWKQNPKANSCVEVWIRKRAKTRESVSVE